MDCLGATQLVEQKWNWEIIIGIATSIVALCALGLSIWQGFLTRKHNRLSVRPHLTVWFTNNISRGKCQIDLINNGIGPAFVKSFTMKVDGEKIEGENGDPIKDAIYRVFPNEVQRLGFEYIGKNHPMAPKDKFRIFKIFFDEDRVPSRTHFSDMINRLDLEIEYESFYGEKFFFNSKDHKPY